MNILSKENKYWLKPFKLIYVIAILLFFSCKTGADKPIASLEEYRELRKEKLQQPRSLIHNNDGDDSVVPIKSRHFVEGKEHQPRPPREIEEADWEFSIENFLDIRSAGLIGSDVTTISYNTSRPFGVMLHNSNISEVLTWEYNLPGRRNSVPDFIELGTDQLEVTANFARENGFDFFWSHRFNDTHDASHRPDNPSYYFRRFKEEHPHYLFGEIGERLPHGRWSAVDFKHEEIRDLTVEYFTEVCENYDVDGIELDFFRHMYLFGDVARGKIATEEQLEMMTDVIKRIREMTERVGMEKGNPILISVRLPDGIEYLKGVGIDLERWMKDGLIDMVIGSGYFRLNPWEYLVEQGHKYDVKVYASLDESRIREGQHPDLDRNQNAVYRARAAAAWQAGVDGIYSFNEYNTHAGYLSEIGHAEKLTSTNNLYFVTYRNYNPDIYLNNGKQFANLSLLSPGNKVSLTTEPVEFMIEIGDESEPSDVLLILYADEADPEAIKVSFNDVPVSFKKSTGDGLYVFNVSHDSVKAGNNKLAVSYNTLQENITLHDAAVLFCRNPDDPEIKDLAIICLND